MTFYDSQKLQVLQNRIARLVTGVPFRTPTNKLLLDLGWNILSARRHIHGLSMYFKLINTTGSLPDYITNALPRTRQQATRRTLRNASQYSLPQNNTTLFQRSFIPATTRNWNKLPECIRATASPKSFKRGVLQLLGVPPPPPYYILGSKIGNILHAKLRMGMSDLNAHQYSVQKTLTPSCHCKDTPETTNHFITQCPLYTDCRFQLFPTLSNILHFDFSQLSRDTQTHMLLHGTHISADARDGVVRSFHDFLFATKRFRH